MREPSLDQVQALFNRAIALPVAERAALLDVACVGNAVLRAEVEGLLACDAGLREGTDEGVLKSPLVRSPGSTHSEVDGTPSSRKSPVGLSPGPIIILKYRILRLLGEGGMGAVYEAEQESPRRRVALKVIRPGCITPSLLQRFHRETQLLGRLHHPGIAQVYEAGLAADGLPFFAMEFIRGVPLDEYARCHGLDVRARLELVARICDAVQHAHDQGVVHRDLKPANILVEEGGQPKVVDFGVARATEGPLGGEGSPGLTRTGQLVGTPNYMSPEQMAADPAGIDPRVDVYALGVILFELAAHRLPLPLSGRPLAEAIRMIQEEDPPLLGQLVPELRGDVETIASRALEKDPRRRYQSAAELAADLRHWLVNEPIRARPPSTLYHLSKFARRNKALVGGMATTVAALMLGLASTAYLGLAEAEQRRRAEGRAMAEEAARRESDGHRLDARRLLYLANLRLAQQAWEKTQFPHMQELLEEAARGRPGDEDLRGFEWHYLWRLRRGNFQHLDGHPGGATSVAYSPNGRILAIGNWKGGVTIWEGDQRTDVAGSSDRDAKVATVAFSPDGRRLAWGGWNRGGGFVYLRDLEKGKNALMRLAHGSQVRAVGFRDKDRLVTVDQQVHLWDADTGKKLEDADWSMPQSTRAVAVSEDGTLVANLERNARAVVVEATTGRQVFARDASQITAAAISPDRRLFATAESEHAVRLWDVATGRELHAYHGHTDPVRCLTFRQDGRVLASGGGDGTIRLWDVESGQAVRTHKGHPGSVVGLAFRNDGSLATVGLDGVVRFWSQEGTTEVTQLTGHTGSVLGLSLAAGGRRLVSAGGQTVLIWDLPGLKKLARIDIDVRQILSLASSPDGRLLAIGAGQPTVGLWDVATGKQIRALSGNKTGVLSLDFHPDGNRLITCDFSRSAQLWEVATGQRLGTFGDAARPVTFVAFSPDGKFLASAGGDQLLRLWDVATGETIRVMQGQATDMQPLAFSPDVRLIASSGPDWTVRLWDVATGEERHVLRGHQSPVLAVAFSPDGRRLASVADTTVRLWDVATGKEVFTLLPGREGGGCTRVVFGPDGMTLLVGRVDGTVWAWDAQVRGGE